jgi:single-strand DNA-binding protein
MNKVYLTGRICRDLENKIIGDKMLVTTGIAVDEGYGDKKLSYFYDLDVWGKTAETLYKYSGKGRKILVEGRLKMDTWEKEGQKRSKVKIVADSIEFLDYNKEPSLIADAVVIDDEDLPF